MSALGQKRTLVLRATKPSVIPSEDCTRRKDV
jgi:hypothetical protein